MTKSFPYPYVFLFFYCCCALKYHAAAKFLIGGRENCENGRGFLANVAVNTCQDLATLSQSEILIKRQATRYNSLPNLLANGSVY